MHLLTQTGNFYAIMSILLLVDRKSNRWLSTFNHCSLIKTFIPCYYKDNKFKGGQNHV